MIPRLVQYFGSKFRALKRGAYPKPVHRTVVEPFAGGASYSLHFEPRDVILVERDPDIAECWRWLISATPSDVLDLPCETLRSGQDLRELDIPYGAKVLIRLWQRVGAGNTGWKVRDLSNGLSGSGGVWSRARMKHIAEGVRRIKHWAIIEGDYTSAPDVRATWFIDPPYQVAGKVYTFGSDEIDFPKLAAWCRTRKGISLVCEASPADWLPFRSCGVADGTNHKPSPELLWIGGDER